MQQCQEKFSTVFASMLLIQMVHEKWSPQQGFEPTTSQSRVFCLTTRPRRLKFISSEKNYSVQRTSIFRK